MTNLPLTHLKTADKGSSGSVGNELKARPKVITYIGTFTFLAHWVVCSFFVLERDSDIRMV